MLSMNVSGVQNQALSRLGRAEKPAQESSSGSLNLLDSENTTLSSGPGDSVTLTESSPKPQKLSKAQRKALQHAVDFSRGQALGHAVIIGGGPGGLAAAITLAQMGTRVTVLEARADESGNKPMHARPHQISLRKDALNSLKDLGAYQNVMEHSGYQTKEVLTVTDDQETKVETRIPQAQASEPGRFVTFPTMLETDSVSQVRISDVENALYEQALELGVEVRAGVKATLVQNPESDSYRVMTQNVERNGHDYVPYGELEDLGTPDLVIAADGAGSPTRASLGIEVKEESQAKHYLGGHINRGLGPKNHKAAIKEAPGFTRHVMGTGHARYDQTWVSVEVTPEEAAMSAEERTNLLVDKAQYVMGTEVTRDDVGWGAGQLTTVQNRRAERTTAGDNVVLLGDSAGTGSVWVGGGLNLALTTHLSALKNLATRIAEGRDRSTALAIYDRSIQWATSVWHRAGAAELRISPGSTA